MKTPQVRSKYRSRSGRHERRGLGMVAGVSLRKSVNVFMSPDEKRFIEGLAEELGLTETQIVTRTFAWLRRQDDVLQRGVLGLLPPSQLVDIKRRAIQKLDVTPKKKRGK